MEAGDSLIVLKLDRLGRDVQDVLSTIEVLANRQIHVKSLDLDGVDLTSAAGKLQLTVLAAVAAFERDRIKERTKEGLKRAQAEGKKLGRPVATETTKTVQAAKARGLSQSAVAAELHLGIATVKRHWNKHPS
jgi:putative DNA-invertase from lambdoid prophage Rac